MAERATATNITAFGGVYLDVKAGGFAGASFTPDQLPMGGRYDTVPGGSVINFARACSRLGLQTTLMGKVGNDMFGRELCEELRREHRQYPHFTPLLMVSEESTNVGFHFIQEAGVEIRSGIGTANQSLTMEDVVQTLGDHFSQASHVYLGGILKLPELLPELERFTRAAKSLGAKIVLDHGRIASNVSQQNIDYLRTILPYVDYYLPSRDEFLQAWDVQTIEEGLQKARAVTNATIVIKDAEKGAIGVSEAGELIHVPAFEVQVIDTVGAGDTFNAGFIKAQTDGMNLTDSILYANAVAGLKISQKEPPTHEDVATFLLNQHAQSEIASPSRRAIL